MSSYETLDITTWIQHQAQIVQLEKEGRITRTFRRLDPGRQSMVLEAILEEAIERGPTAINIKHVAARAGVAVGSLYQYFGSRDGLLSFAVELCSRYLIAEMDRVRPVLVSLPLRDGLAAYLMGGIECGQMQAGLVRFYARAAYQGDAHLSRTLVEPVGRVIRETVAEMLRSAAQRGEIRADVDLDAAVRIVNVLTIAITDGQLLPYLNHYYQATDDDMPVARLISALLDLVLNGVAL